MEIQITENAEYNGQDMAWTEEMESIIIKEDITVFHCSDSFISEFLKKETCFFSTESLTTGHVYKYTIKAGTEILTDGEEIRVEISGTINYIGEYEMKGTGEFKEKYSNYEGWIKKEICKRVKK